MVVMEKEDLWVDQALQVKTVLLDYMEDQVLREKQGPKEIKVHQESRVTLDHQEILDRQAQTDKVDPQDPKDKRETKETEYVDIVSSGQFISTFPVGCSRK